MSFDQEQREKRAQNERTAGVILLGLIFILFLLQIAGC